MSNPPLYPILDTEVSDQPIITLQTEIPKTEAIIDQQTKNSNASQEMKENDIQITQVTLPKEILDKIIFKKPKKLTVKLHGTFEGGDHTQYNLKGDTIGKDPQNVKEWIEVQRNIRIGYQSLPSKWINKALSSLGEKHPWQKPLFEDEEASYYDCRPVIKGKEVQFKVPPFELGSVPLKYLSNSKFSQFIQKSIYRLDQSYRFDRFNSWYYPTVNDPDPTLPNLLKTLESHNQITLQVLISIFRTRDHLDQFSTFLNTKIKGIPYQDKVDTKPLEVIMHTDHFLTTIFSLMVDANTPLVNLKIFIFFSFFLKTPGVDIILGLENYYLLAKTITSMTEIPFNLFEYSDDLSDIVKKNSANPNSISKLFDIYYLNAIAVVLYDDLTSYQYVHGIIVNYIQKIVDKFDWSDLEKSLTPLLGHSKAEISHLGFILLSLVQSLSFDPKVSKFLESPTYNLIGHLKKLSQSKKSHVRQNTKSFFAQLTQPNWKDLLTKIYRSSELLLEDLIKVNAQIPLDGNPPIISTVIFDFFQNTFQARKEAPKRSLALIQGIETEIFIKIFSEIFSCIHSHRRHPGVLFGFQFLTIYTRFLLCERKFFKHVEKLTQLFDFICDTKQKMYQNIKSSAIELFIEMIKNKENFKAMTSLDKTFFPRLLILLVDSFDLITNQNSWKLLYKIIKFYSTSALEKSFFEQLFAKLSEINDQNKSQLILLKNSSKYLSKILKLPGKKEKKVDDDLLVDQDEEKFSKKGNNLVDQSVTSTYDQCITQIISIMMSKNLNLFFLYFGVGSNGWSWPFVSGLYDSLINQSHCKNLLTAMKKDAKMNETLNKMIEMNKWK